MNPPKNKAELDAQRLKTAYEISKAETYRLKQLYRKASDHAKMTLKDFQQKAFQRKEEYDFKEPKENPFEDFTYKQVALTIENMKAKELRKFMEKWEVYNEKELWDFINSCFSIAEE